MNGGLDPTSSASNPRQGVRPPRDASQTSDGGRWGGWVIGECARRLGVCLVRRRSRRRLAEPPARWRGVKLREHVRRSTTAHPRERTLLYRQGDGRSDGAVNGSEARPAVNRVVGWRWSASGQLQGAALRLGRAIGVGARAQASELSSGCCRRECRLAHSRDPCMMSMSMMASSLPRFPKTILQSGFSCDR